MTGGCCEHPTGRRTKYTVVIVPQKGGKVNMSKPRGKFVKQDEFDMMKLMLNKGLKPTEVGRITGRSERTIRKAKSAETYEEYMAESKKRHQVKSSRVDYIEQLRGTFGADNVETIEEEGPIPFTDDDQAKSGDTLHDDLMAINQTLRLIYNALMR